MNLKLAMIVLLSSILLVGVSYYLINKSEGTQAQISNYQVTDIQKPKLEVKKTSEDLGRIKVSQTKSAEFIIKNIGDKPLQLFGVSSSCGCTTGQIIINGNQSNEFGMHSQSDYVGKVGTGGYAAVKVTYRPYVMPVYGVVEREVYISTNDPSNPKLTFQVKAFVE